MPYTITLLKPLDIQNLEEAEKDVPAYMHGSCTICGKCCEYFGCPALDTVTHKCKVYGNRPVVCRQWPINREHISLVNCQGYHYVP
ncbi:hypothetical protein ES703_94003 [subsurface metagenome]